MKDNKIMLIAVPVMCALLAILAYLMIVNSNNGEKDSIRFKEEYEALNGSKVTTDIKYSELDISEVNPIKYADYDELLDIINNKSGIIYLGFPECPWCRSALPVLLAAAEENEVEDIYYMNILNERDSYVVEDGELTYALDDNGNEKKGSEGYFKLLKALDRHLDDYIVTYEGKNYDVGEKRIYAPTMIFVKEGKVLGIHVSTVVSHLSGFDKLTDEQYEELYNIYEGYILDIYSETCSSDTAC